MTEIHTPDAATIQAVAEFTGRPASEMLKTILFDAGGQTVAVLLPGDHEVNEEKVARLFFPTLVRPFEEKDFAERGFAKGYVGPQGMPADAAVIADPSVRLGANWVTGANRPDHHVTGANEGRDFRVDRWEDVVQAVEGDPCPVDGGTLRAGTGIVLGHIYQLGTKYSEPLKATFLDEDGTEQPYLMGCYGIGISRTLAALAEQYHDDAGLTLPAGLAPYEAVVVATNMDQPPVVETAERLYESLRGAGVQVVFDDRAVTAGVKFADADLIGYPVQVVVGKRGVEAGRRGRQGARERRARDQVRSIRSWTPCGPGWRRAARGPEPWPASRRTCGASWTGARTSRRSCSASGTRRTTWCSWTARGSGRTGSWRRRTPPPRWPRRPGFRSTTTGPTRSRAG